MFKKRFEELCAERGLSPSNVCEQLGLSNSAYSKWSNNTKPRSNTLKLAANFFGVSTDYLLGIDIVKDKILTTLDDPQIILSPDEKWFVLQLRKLSKEQKVAVEGFLIERVNEVEKEKTEAEIASVG
jgi:putative transcriptional regulator